MAEDFVEDIIAAVPSKEGSTGDEKLPEGTDVQVGREATPDESSEQIVSKENKAAPSDAAIEELATQLGWRADHVGEDAVDAKTYILRSKDIQQSMSQHNKDLKNQLSTLNSSVEALKVHNERVYQAEVKKLQGEIAVLKKERRSAIELADVDKVEELDQQIDEKQKDLNAPKKVDVTTGATDNPVYDEWIKDNSWYLENDEMAQFADAVAQQYRGAPLERIYSLVRVKVAEVFPEKFVKVKDEAVKNNATVKTPVGPKSPVESSSGKGNTGAFSRADLTENQIQIMNQFVRGGIMTEAQYIADIAKMKE